MRRYTDDVADVGTQLMRRLEARYMGGTMPSLSHPATACLWVMTLNARDTSTDDVPGATYFRGWEHLARVGLARTEYDDAAKRAVARVVRELTDAGVVASTGRRHEKRHGQAMYELTI